MLKVNAKIYFKSEKEGGLKNPAFSGIQPSMDIDGELVMCKIIFGEEGTPMPLNNDYDVIIELAYGEMFQEKLKPGFRFNINLASRILGNGVIKC